MARIAVRARIRPRTRASGSNAFSGGYVRAMYIGIGTLLVIIIILLLIFLL